MTILPIIDRELRVAVRQRRTWLTRLLLAGIALVAFALVYLLTSPYTPLSRVGTHIFTALLWVGIFYCLLAGPFATVDCIAREKRDGTLGLLFLTDLRGYDVVLGKMGVASLSLATGGAAALPIFFAPVLMGGVKLQQFGMVVLTLGGTMFLSLAVGTLMSSFFRSARAALGSTLVALFGLTFGLPLAGELFFHLGFRGRWPPFMYACCPLYGLVWCMDLRGGLHFPYWLNVAGLQLLAWSCIFWASSRVQRLWDESTIHLGAASGWFGRVGERFARGGAWRRRCRRKLMELNPVAWLESRDRAQDWLLWGVCLAAAVLVAAKHFHAPRRWPQGEDMFIWPLVGQYVLCLWMAVQTPRRFADDRETGALELLLCTSLPAREAIRGLMMALRRRFGRAFVALLLVDLLIVVAFFHNYSVTRRLPRGEELLKFGFWAALVFAAQTYSFARVGLYQALARKNAITATFLLIFNLGLLPYLLVLVEIIVFERISWRMPGGSGLRENVMLLVWVLPHLLCFAVFLAQANYQLKRHFRALAARTTGRA